MASYFSIHQGSDRRFLLLLEEIKSQNNTQILLLQQLLARCESATIESDFQDEFGLPLSSTQQLMKLESDCVDCDIKAKLVNVLCFQFTFIIILTSMFLLLYGLNDSQNAPRSCTRSLLNFIFSCRPLFTPAKSFCLFQPKLTYLTADSHLSAPLISVG